MFFLATSVYWFWSSIDNKQQLFLGRSPLWHVRFWGSLWAHELNLVLISCSHCSREHPSLCFRTYVFLGLPCLFPLWPPTSLRSEVVDDDLYELSDRDTIEDIGFESYEFDLVFVWSDSSNDEVEVVEPSWTARESLRDFMACYGQRSGKQLD